ncbi:transposase [Crocosphaera watsonii WH 8501]|uniref:Tc1-like transposase DDE domain-containing protein n=1 Tax=Crocosphaera watsonii WH 8501 TaxID=165597 RepID=Q4BUE7_CROWT|nr:transposase [Crocosphaera watsonii]EAM47531.1 hypothetical protein CwatDRAFT_0059 [Crocosphaera watsonii WH 8501]EAM52789.1 hypothetical protein CwatDRAFT_6036 [Crocosphaera watsonii WH 8501]
MLEQGIHLISTDEMTGIQALERLFPNKRVKPKQVEKIEFEYERHGTLSLIANWDVARGKVVSPSIGPTRTEQDFLSDESHRIRFVYIPKHTSWLNQIECWFSILVRRLLKRITVRSTEELSQKILNFIDYFNQHFAKPFVWKFKGFKDHK